jgi:hypothetical protein
LFTSDSYADDDDPPRHIPRTQRVRLSRETFEGGRTGLAPLGIDTGAGVKSAETTEARTARVEKRVKERMVKVWGGWMEVWE